MSSPYSPENQQPHQPQQGGSPQQGGFQPGGYGQQQTQQMPVVGGYGQQPTQQMPVVGGYGQSQGYGQQARQGYYAQGQFQGAPGAAQPPKKKTGLIIGIIAAVVVIALIAGVAVWALFKDHSSSDEASASPSAPSTAAPTSAPSVAPSPSAPVAPAPAPRQSAPPVGTKPSPAPIQGTGSSGSVSSDEEYGVMSECKSALSQTVQQGKLANWTVTRDGVDSSGRPQYQASGQLNGTLFTGKNGTFNFTCTAVYHQDKGVYEAWSSIDAY